MMIIARWLRLLPLLGIGLAVAAGCATAPTQEMSDARQAIQAARDADAARHAPAALGSAETLLATAEQFIGTDAYESARAEAVAARQEAVKARNIALAIGAAEAALDRAYSLGAEWGDSRKLLDKAEEAAASGDEAMAVRLAGIAQLQGENAINQYYLEIAKMLLLEAEQKKTRMSPSQLADLKDASVAFRNQDGKRAHDLVSRLLASLRGATER
ncbi:MAG: hypothetical protein QNJ87_16605 [Gammaproteobacteria bacterium]|nr:hypothetical protein [Gammaproteobacteria bacterium]